MQGGRPDARGVQFGRNFDNETRVRRHSRSVLVLGMRRCIVAQPGLHVDSRQEEMRHGTASVPSRMVGPQWSK